MAQEQPVFDDMEDDCFDEDDEDDEEEHSIFETFGA